MSYSHCEHCSSYKGRYCSFLGINCRPNFGCASFHRRLTDKEMKAKMELYQLGVIDAYGDVTEKYKDIIEKLVY